MIFFLSLILSRNQIELLRTYYNLWCNFELFENILAFTGSIYIFFFFQFKIWWTTLTSVSCITLKYISYFFSRNLIFHPFVSQSPNDTTSCRHQGLKILVNTNILVFGFYGYIREISIKWKLFKIHENIWKNYQKIKIHILLLFCKCNWHKYYYEEYIYIYIYIYIFIGLNI